MYNSFILLFIQAICASSSPSTSSKFPLVINTWSGPFTNATFSAFQTLTSHPLSSDPQNSNIPALDAVQAGCQTCQSRQCDFTVGYGGSPDESCETTLDALIIDGNTMNAGAVANLRRVKDAIGVARAVMDLTKHTMLAGDQATVFALQNGFEEETLETKESRDICESWKRGGCQPNYRRKVLPDSSQSCGPYSATGSMEWTTSQREEGVRNPRQASHDTISLIAIDELGNMAAATSTNGALHKIPGRVGDGPIVGSGAYVDSEVGGCGATGDGDVMMRFLPCYQAVESMRKGMSPQEAADDAMWRMRRRVGGSLEAGIVVVDRHGDVGASATGWDTFSYSWRAGNMDAIEIVNVKPIKGHGREEL